MASSTPSSEPPLLCRLGQHRPQSLARWNHGYYFSKCQRCGTDLVRTAYGRWQVPEGFRVVWQAKAPADAVAATLEPTDLSPREREPASERPIPFVAELEDEPPPLPPVEPLPTEAPAPPSIDLLATEELVLAAEPPAGEQRLLWPPKRDEEIPAAAEPLPIQDSRAAPPPRQDVEPSPATPDGEAPAPVPAPASPPIFGRQPYRPYAIPDFMGDDQPYAAPTLPKSPSPTPPLAEPPPPLAAGEAEQPDGASRASPLAWVQPLAAQARQRLEAHRARRASQAHDQDPGGIGVQDMGTPALAFLASVIIIAAIIFFTGRRGTDEAQPPRQVVAAAPVVQPEPQSSPPTLSQPARDAAYVTASIVNCRLAPAQQAASLRRIVRGERVAVLARDDNWASIAYRGRQCWILSRYISPVEPLAADGQLWLRPPARQGAADAAPAASDEYG